MAVINAAFYFMLCLSISIYSCDAYKALVVTQMPSKSHSILNDGIVQQILKDGNEVTFIRSIEFKNAPPTLRQIDVSSNAKVMPANAINIKAIMDGAVPTNDHEYVKRYMIAAAINTVENEDVQKLINDPNEHFDVVIVEFMDNDLLASLAAVFDCPLIWMSPIETNSDILSRIDAVPNPSQVPDYLSPNAPPFSFRQRVEELWARIEQTFLYYWTFDEMQIEVYNRLITPAIVKRGRIPPSFHDIRYSASLVLGYSHVSMGDPISLPQSYKAVGGYHIDENIKPLPEELKKIMDSSKDGVIYFSMGSNLKSSDWPAEIKQSLVKMLGGLKQTVLWKFEEQLPNTPKNVHISNWLPQLSILSHPNCVLFITHAGLLSIAEALHVGVPIIGIPGFADQFVNINRAVVKGYGLKLDMTYNVVDDLKVAIDEMISNPSYRQKAKELSFVYHDRDVKPKDEIAFWVRHVVQTRGAPHLRSPALGLPLYQRLYLDLGALLFLVILFSFKLLKFIYAVVFPKKNLENYKKPENMKKSEKKKKSS